MKVALSVYNNLDGGACAILGREAFDDLEIVTYSDFGIANSEIVGKLEVYRDDPEIELVIIAGLPLAPAVIEWLIDNMSAEKVIVLNHNDVGFPKQIVSWLKEDPFTTSSQLLYEELITRGHIDRNNGRLIAFLDLVKVLELNDMPHPLFGIAKDLDRLYHFLGVNQFVVRSYFQGFAPAERYGLDMLQLRERRLLDETTFHTNVDVRELKFIWAIVGYGDLIDVVGKACLEKGSYHDFKPPDYGVAICPEKDSVFLFSNGEVDVGNIARSVQGYGTRTKACFKLPLMVGAVAQVKQVLMMNKKD